MDRKIRLLPDDLYRVIVRADRTVRVESVEQRRRYVRRLLTEFFFSLIRRLPSFTHRYTLFPYTTLFRSVQHGPTRRTRRLIRSPESVSPGNRMSRLDRKSTRLNSSHIAVSRMPSSA